MKLAIVFLAAIVFAACSQKQQVNDSVNENKKAMRQQIAVKNEATEITRSLQKLEQQGRAMEMFRRVKTNESRRECVTAMEDGQKQTVDLDGRIKNLPDNYKAPLAPIINDLNECLSCSDKALTACVNARAAVNQAIKEIYAP